MALLLNKTKPTLYSQ